LSLGHPIKLIYVVESRVQTNESLPYLSFQPDPQEKLVKIAFWALCISLAIHIALSLALTPPIGDDAYLHLSWLEDFAKLRAQGIAYPRWLPATFGGIGSPTFYLYPPLTSFVGDFYYSLGIAHSGTALFHAVNVTLLLVSTATSFAWLRLRGFEKQYAVIGALIYSVAAYRYLDIFTRAALAEHAAFAWIPLVFIAIDLCGREQELKNYLAAIVAGITGWSLLLLTNIPAASLTAMLAVVYSVAIYRRQILRVWPVIVSGILAVIICAFYLVPVLHFQQFAQTSQLWGFDVFGSRWHHFLIELFETGPRKGSILIVAVIMFAVGVVMSWILLTQTRGKATPQRLFARGLLCITLFCLVLQVPFIADPIWDVFKPLQFLQFSWRLSIGLVLVLAAASALVLQLRLKYASYFVISVALISLFFYVRYTYIASTFPPPPYMVEPIRKGAPEYTNRYVDLARDSLRAWALTLVDKPLFSADQPVTYTNVERIANTLTASISNPNMTPVRIKMLWWPQWRMIVDGPNVKLSPDSSGLMITSPLEAGYHSVSLSLEESDSERTGRHISYAGIALFSMICLAGYTLDKRK
jgi:hypothetical protein